MEEETADNGLQAGYKSYNDPTTKVDLGSGHEPAPISSRGEFELPGRYRAPLGTDQDPNLAEDLRRTRTRGRRRTRKTLHYKIDADSIDGEESDGSSVNEDYEVDSIASSIEEQLTWRGRMQYLLHHHYFHIIIVVLVSLDALIVLFELLLDVGAFNNRLCRGETPFEQGEECHYMEPDHCIPSAIQVLERHNISAIEPVIDVREHCSCKFRRGKLVCDFDRLSRGVNPGFVLHIGSLIILSIFLGEILLKMIAFRLKYFTHKFEVFDGCVVVISWVLDIASIVQEEAFETAASLIIILRLWRVVRVVNGAVLSSKTQSDKDLEDARNEARKIVHALHKCQDKLDDTMAEKRKLAKKVEALEGASQQKRVKD